MTEAVQKRRTQSSPRNEGAYLRSSIADSWLERQVFVATGEFGVRELLEGGRSRLRALVGTKHGDEGLIAGGPNRGSGGGLGPLGTS